MQAFLYSLENEVPLIAFCQDRCFTLFDHPLVDSLHTIYHEPKVLIGFEYLARCLILIDVSGLMVDIVLQAEVMPSIDQLLAAVEIQVSYVFYLGKF